MTAPSASAGRWLAKAPAEYYGRSHIATMLGVDAGTVSTWAARTQNTDWPFPTPDVIVKARPRGDTTDFGRDSVGRPLRGHEVPGWSEESLEAVRVWHANRRSEPGQYAAEPERRKPVIFYGPGAIARQLGKDSAIVSRWIRQWADTTHPFPPADVVIKDALSGRAGRDLFGWSEDALTTVIPEWDARRSAVIAERAAHARAEETAATVEGRIWGAYRELAAEPLAWVRLADIRARLDGILRVEQDQALRAMSKGRRAVLVPAPQPNEADLESALEIRGVANHLIAVPGSS